MSNTTKSIEPGTSAQTIAPITSFSTELALHAVKSHAMRHKRHCWLSTWCVWRDGLATKLVSHLEVGMETKALAESLMATSKRKESRLA